MKRRINYSKLIRNVVILAVSIFAIVYVIKKINAGGEEWVGVESGYISISSKHRGLIITDEIVYKTLCPGYIENAENEGKRIKKSEVIASFISTNDAEKNKTNADTKQEDSKDEKDIIATTEENVSIDKNQVKLDADKLYADLKNKLKNGENKEAKRIKRELAYTLEHLNKLDKDTMVSKSSFNENEKYIGSKDASFEQHFNIISSESGVVSYYIDNLAGKLKYEDRYKLNYQKLFNEPHDFVNNINRKVQKNEKLLKLMYKQKWHLLCESSLEDLDTYKIDDEITIYSNNEEFDAIIVDKFKSKDIGILCLEIAQVSNNLNNSRIINLTIESDEVAGILIPPHAIVSKDYVKGVYVKGLEDEKIFRPIEILGHEDEYTIVSEGSYTYKDENGGLKTVDTVNRNDKVLVKSE